MAEGFSGNCSNVSYILHRAYRYHPGIPFDKRYGSSGNLPGGSLDLGNALLHYIDPLCNVLGESLRAGTFREDFTLDIKVMNPLSETQEL
jgi:hypothetical protein